MAQVNITRKAEVLKGFQLTSSDDMFAALKYLSPRGYSGYITVTPGGVWTLNLTAPNQASSQSGVINDWVVIKNDATAEIVPAAQATSLYQIAP